MTDQTPAAPELTPEQYGLLDALRDVALSPDTPAAQYAAEQLARLTADAFGLPPARRSVVLPAMSFHLAGAEPRNRVVVEHLPDLREGDRVVERPLGRTHVVVERGA